MKKNAKKWVAAATVGTAVVTTMVGCSSDKEGSATTATSASATQAATQTKAPENLAPLELSIMLPIFKTNWHFPKASVCGGRA